MRAARLVGSLAVALLGLGLSAGELLAQAPTDSQPTVARSPSTDYSANQLYNSANADARAGNTALAVLGYERARVLAPTDPDLRSNLRHVRELAGLPPSSESWLEAYGRFANPNALYWIGIAGLALGGACLLGLRRRAGFRAMLLAGAVLGFAMVSASLVNAAATYSVLSESVALRLAPASVSPIAGADPLFNIPAAATVRVLDRHGGFALVRDSQGREGWVAATDLAAVIPGSAD
jgi:hypothetical protein